MKEMATISNVSLSALNKAFKVCVSRGLVFSVETWISVWYLAHCKHASTLV